MRRRRNIRVCSSARSTFGDVTQAECMHFPSPALQNRLAALRATLSEEVRNPSVRGGEERERASERDSSAADRRSLFSLFVFSCCPVQSARSISPGLRASIGRSGQLFTCNRRACGVLRRVTLQRGTEVIKSSPRVVHVAVK